LGEASDLDLLFWNPYYQIKKQLPDEKSKSQVFEGFRSFFKIAKYFEHDIVRTFSAKFIRGLFKSQGRGFPHLRLFLYAFASLRQHLRHYRNVASVNKFRLDGQLPVSEKVALSQIVADAVCTASYRCRLPVRESASLTPGFINSYVYEDAAADIIPAMLELVVYNLIKNAFKAMLQARKTTIRGDSFNALEQATKETTEFGVSVCLRKDREYRNVMVIAVEDNAAGFDFNALISEAKHVIADPKNQEIIRQMSVFVRLKKWEDSPFVLRTLSLGEVLDLAFVPRISGFHVQQMSSGIGLAEAAEFSSYLGMKILVTNTYQGGALINLILGPEEDVNQVIMRELGHRS
ncbi:MAG: hypothetical protein KKA31_01910, partial [Candidatus Margulisbacteria bacterium]|nr:hypothetical protein [Candidatus Margulisiibacteriota bacterium]